MTTILQLVNFLRGGGADILILGLLNALLASLVKKAPDRHPRKKRPTGGIFLPGFPEMLLYAVFLPALQHFSLCGEHSFPAICGFSFGCAAVFLHAFFRRRAGKAGPSLQGRAEGRETRNEISEILKRYAAHPDKKFSPSRGGAGSL